MLPDRWNPRLWVRDWLLKPGSAEQVNTTAQGEPKAVGYGVPGSSAVTDSEGRIVGVRIVQLDPTWIGSGRSNAEPGQDLSVGFAADWPPRTGARQDAEHPLHSASSRSAQAELSVDGSDAEPT